MFSKSDIDYSVQLVLQYGWFKEENHTFGVNDDVLYMINYLSKATTDLLLYQ